MRSFANIIGRNRKDVFLLLVILFTVLIVWHLPHPFFFGDEWDLLDEFVSGNMDVFRSHNEHLYVLGKPLFFLLSRAFSDALWIVHFLLLCMHALNAYLVGMLIFTATRDNKITIAAAFIFALHPFHFENLGMLLQINSLLQQTFFLLALQSMHAYVADKKRMSFWLFLLFTFVQFWWFGTGLTSGMVLVVIAAMQFWAHRISFTHFLPLVVIVAACTTAYIILSQGVSSAISPPQASDHLPAIAGHLTVSLVNNLPRVITGIVSHPPWFVTLGVWVVVFSLGSWWYRGSTGAERKHDALWLVAGVLLYSAYLISISFTRYDWGAGQGLAPRYAYYYLPGVLLILSIVVKPLLRSPGVVARRCLYALFGCAIAGMVIGSRFAMTVFWEQRNIANIAALADPATPDTRLLQTAHPTMPVGQMRFILSALRR